MFGNFKVFGTNIVDFYNKTNKTTYIPTDIAANVLFSVYTLSTKKTKYFKNYVKNHFEKDKEAHRYDVIGNNDLEQACLFFIEFITENTLSVLEGEGDYQDEVTSTTEVEEVREDPENLTDYTDDSVIIKHEKFELIKELVNADEPVFLTGPAGSGKNVICKQIAQELGLDFYFTNAVTQEYKITGFTDAMGNFHESQFYKAFKNGGIFMLDEMDASIPEALVILNAAIANRYFDFPAPIGFVQAHPNFRVIAAGNTFGLGADYDYVGRNQLDAASLDRFALIRVSYDRRIEMKVTKGNKELVKFADDFRSAAIKAGVRVIVSYRALSRIAALEGAIGKKEALYISLVKNLQKDDVQMIIKNMKTASSYKTALTELMVSL